MIEKHCLYVGLLEGEVFECNYPGMEYVDANCSGYEDCEQYKAGTRQIEAFE